jgi:aconitate hydratase
LKSAKPEFQKALAQMLAAPTKARPGSSGGGGLAVAEAPPTTLAALEHGAVVIAAITSCTNTSNPSVLLAAGLLAKKAVERGLSSQPWVKTSLAPGSQVVTAYLAKSGLLPYLEQLGFHLVGYGCTTCIGNSGPLPEDVAAVVREKNLVVCSVLSGNRNFEGRIQQDVRANYLASPPLVVAYALAGKMSIDITTEPLGTGRDGQPVFLRDLWPSNRDIRLAMGVVEASMFREKYADVFKGDDRWRTLPVPEGEVYAWDPDSTYIRNPPYFESLTLEPAPLQNIKDARVLAVLGDSVTTDHISPAGSIKADSPAGKYLISHGVGPAEFNSYGARRGNHEVMMRGTFANIRLRNQLVQGVEGGFTTHMPTNEQMTIYDAAMRYKGEGVGLVILAGKEYGSGSSRDWAAKGTALLGVKVVIAESFERIHRSNLVQMGVLPLQFRSGENVASLKLTGHEMFAIDGITSDLKPRGTMNVIATRDGGTIKFSAILRIDTPEEVVAFAHGGILPYVLRQLVQARH